MVVTEAAKHYAERGWRVIQLHGIAADGRCTCRERDKPGHERSAGKHPVDNGWQNSAAMTADEIDTVWGGWRAKHNLGIATGAPSGIFILDVDPDNGGREGITRLQADHGPLTAEYAVETGSGGWHLYFAMPTDFEPTNRRGGLKEYPGLDVRGTGGQVVAPPSVSAKGSYRVLSNGTPGPAPDWLLDLLRPPAPAPEPVAAAAPAAAGSDERVERYAQTVRAAEIARLTAMREAAVAEGQQYRGEPWNETCFHVACTLLELANSEWTTYTATDAYSELHANAPRDNGFTDLDVNKVWESATTRVGTRGRPYPEARSTAADEVASWASEPGVRIDPILLKKKPEAAPAAAPEREVPLRTWDDLGNAMRVVDHFGQTLRWVDEAEQWAIYRQGSWQLVKPNVVQGYIQRMFDELVPATEALHYADEKADPDDDDTERERFLKWLKGQRMSARIAAAQREAQARHELHSSIKDYDVDHMLLNVANGVIDLRTGELLPHRADRLLMKQSPVAYDPDAQAPQWHKFLDRVQPDPEMQAYIQRILGYTLTGSIEEQCFFVWTGDGANGKSLAAKMVSLVLGDYGGSIAPGVLLASADEQHPTGWADMAGRRWLSAQETAPGKRLDEAKIKEFTGGQEVAARFMAKDFFRYLPVGKIHLVSNHLPLLSADQAVWRRTHLIRWDVTIPVAEQDRRLEQKLAGELEGILAWLVNGAVEWQSRGLDPAPAALEHLSEWRGDSDSFGDFLRERTMPAPGAKTPAGSLYRAYVGWAYEQGIRKPMTQPSFVQAMIERKYPRYRDARSRGFMNVVPVAVTAALPWEEEQTA